MSMAGRIKELRIAAGLTQEELGDRLGLQKSAIAKYENGRVENIKRSTIQAMAELFRVKPSYILDLDEEDHPLPANVFAVNKVKNVPILGKICAGNGVAIEENFQGTMAVDSRVPCDYILYVQGDSMMNSNICDGDMVYVVKRNDIWENGKIHVMGIYGTEDGVIRRVDVLEDGRYLLTPSNPAYDPKIYSRDEAFVIGIVTGVFRAF